MVRKHSKSKDHSGLEAFADIAVEYLRACAVQPILAEGLALLPYRLIGEVARREEDGWVTSDGRKIDEWNMGAIHDTSKIYGEHGIGISTPFFSVGVGARRGAPIAPPMPKIEGLAELITALKSLKG